MSAKKDSANERWRTAVHEAAHWAFAEYLGISNPQEVSIIPRVASVGHVSMRPPLFITPESSRDYLLMLVAGRVAENVITGTRRWPDGTDFLQGIEIGKNVGGAWPTVCAMEVAAGLVREPLWVSILTCASVLFQAKHLDGEAAREVWFVARPEECWVDRRGLEATWIAAGGAPTLERSDRIMKGVTTDAEVANKSNASLEELKVRAKKLTLRRPVGAKDGADRTGEAWPDQR